MYYYFNNFTADRIIFKRIEVGRGYNLNFDYEIPESSINSV